MGIHRVYRFFQDRFRPRRMQAFAGHFGITSQTRIIDVGGSTQNWGYITATPHVTICNIDVDDRSQGRFTFKRVDGTRLPFENDSFDVAYSNSVIEHVGDWDKQKCFAEEIRRISKNYYVQTPNRWFLVEPHFIAPIIHLLPRKLYRRLIPLFSAWYWINRPSDKEVDAMFDEIRLLDRRAMRELFPDAVLLEEKFLFLTKSLIAVRLKEAVQLSDAAETRRAERVRPGAMERPCRAPAEEIGVSG